MAELTVTGIQGLKPADKYQKYPVSKGLFIGVATDGVKGFLLRYSVRGQGQKEYRLPKPFGIKTGPATTTLAEARLLAAQAQALGKEGVDYQVRLQETQEAAAKLAAQKQAENLTVNDLYNAWIGTVRRKDNSKDLRRLFERDVLP